MNVLELQKKLSNLHTELILKSRHLIQQIKRYGCHFKVVLYPGTKSSISERRFNQPATKLIVRRIRYFPAAESTSI